jgi:hypothetical protein
LIGITGKNIILKSKIQAGFESGRCPAARRTSGLKLEVQRLYLNTRKSFTKDDSI